ncbi:hypothetical protein ABZW03_19345, partial [Kitasatospora sp. NPDC004799]|uniref:hypothetical protein n=1 Tax=Kitasatospora sp. NPDC004799 TaxID=3154460 RepID=UPI0033A5F29A
SAARCNHRGPCGPVGSSPPGRDVAVVVAGAAATTVVAVQVSGPRGGEARPAESMLDRRTGAPSAAIALAQNQAWAAVGGLEHVTALHTAQRGYVAAVDGVVSAAAGATSDAQVEAAMRKVGESCEALAGATRRADEYFTVPDPAGQLLWARLLSGYRQLTTACRNLAARPDTANAQAVGAAYRAAVEAGGRMATAGPGHPPAAVRRGCARRCRRRCSWVRPFLLGRGSVGLRSGLVRAGARSDSSRRSGLPRPP